MLLRPEERRCVKGILINKFRGDLRLFEEGRKMLEELCGIPVLGVVPYYHDIHIEEEDSVALAAKSAAAQRGKINVAVVLLRHISNFTDFDALEREPRVHLFYSNNVDELAKADILILPGSKSTLDDLYELRRNGVAQAILRARREGATVLGICGGYQMMGVQIRDPHHVEGDIEAMPGLGLLPMTTEMLGEKVTRQVRFTFADKTDNQMEGYEIHMGETLPVEGSAFQPLNRLGDGQDDGCLVDEKCMGSYIHGILDNPAFIDRLLAPHGAKLTEAATAFDYHAFKEEQYDKLADHIRRYVDVPKLYEILRGER
jgi:adenosylcobyric acid synthase